MGAKPSCMKSAVWASMERLMEATPTASATCTQAHLDLFLGTLVAMLRGGICICSSGQQGLQRGLTASYTPADMLQGPWPRHCQHPPGIGSSHNCSLPYEGQKLSQAGSHAAAQDPDGAESHTLEALMCFIACEPWPRLNRHST